MTNRGRQWTDEQNQLFTKLWKEGKTRGEIADIMAKQGRHLSAGSVSDRARTLGLEPRALGRTMGWSDDAKKRVTELYKDGMSATKIASEVQDLHPGASRNSVIGVIHRMGLKRKAPKPPKYTATKKPKGVFGQDMRINASECRPDAVKTKVETKPLPKPRKEDRDRIGPTLMELKPNSCRWPVGVKPNGEQMFCGETAEDGSSYCCEHHARSVSKVTPEQRKKMAEAMRERIRQGKVVPKFRRAA